MSRSAFAEARTVPEAGVKEVISAATVWPGTRTKALVLPVKLFTPVVVTKRPLSSTRKPEGLTRVILTGAPKRDERLPLILLPVDAKTRLLATS